MLGKLEIIVEKGGVSHEIGAEYKDVYKDREVKENLGVELEYNNTTPNYEPFFASQ